MEYTERLFVPLRWWVQATMFLASVWLAFIVALPAVAAWAAAGVLATAVYALFLGLGSARISIHDGDLHAGTAHIALHLLGVPEPLEAEDTRRVHGVDADARAFLVMRPYLKRSVKVPVHDPADPTPYWLLSTRRPQALVNALRQSAPSTS